MMMAGLYDFGILHFLLLGGMSVCVSTDWSQYYCDWSVFELNGVDILKELQLPCEKKRSLRSKEIDM